MKFISKTVCTFSGIMLAFTSCSLLPMSNDLIHSTDNNLSQKELNLKFEVRCAAGFTTIPADLNILYLEQSKSFNNIDSATKSPILLKNDTDFYGFTYSVFDNKNSNESKTNCSKQRSEWQNIKFVDNPVNNIVRMYISAVIFNETTVFKEQFYLKENNVNQTQPNLIRLCMNAKCGLNGENAAYKSFDYINLADIKYARTFADSYLFINTMDSLRKIVDESEIMPKLADSELTQILTQARIIAYKKSDEDKK